MSAQSAQFRNQVEVVAIDGFGGYKIAAKDQLAEATTVMDPFHVVAPAGAKLDLTPNGCSTTRWGTGDTPVTRSTVCAARFAPVCRC